VRSVLQAAVLGAMLSAGCRSYSDEAVDSIYRDVLQWDGRDDVARARMPSVDHWRRVDER